MFIFTLVTSQNNAKFCAAYKWVKFFICCCWRPLPGNFYARRRFSSSTSTSSSASSSFLFIFVSQLSLALSSLSYSRKFAANLDFCIFISSGFGFNVVPRKLPKFNRVNDKVFSLLSLLCLPFLFFSTLHYKQQRENEMKRKWCWHNKKDNDNKRCEQKLRSRQVLNLASVQSWPFDALFK